MDMTQMLVIKPLTSRLEMQAQLIDLLCWLQLLAQTLTLLLLAMMPEGLGQRLAQLDKL